MSYGGFNHKIGSSEGSFRPPKATFCAGQLFKEAAELGNRIPMSTYHRKERAPFR